LSAQYGNGGDETKYIFGVGASSSFSGDLLGLGGNLNLDYRLNSKTSLGIHAVMAFGKHPDIIF
jgi:hypothetical protein